jgi:3',5'-cyclic AMP phosphodiesterase CpdA
MRTIAHLSDLHFGATDPTIVSAAIAAVVEAQPDLVVISGDLTQRARSHQFRAARAFLDKLPRPRIVVPGNHDVPLWNVFSRGLTPLVKYRRIIGDELEPFYADSEIAVLGLNTTRSLTIKGGRLNRGQAARAGAHFASLPREVTRIVVTHHPFAHLDAHGSGDILGRALMAMSSFATANVDLVLSGHLHRSYAGMAIRYPGSTTLLVQAGTATSVRNRGEVNSFNLLSIQARQVTIHRMEWQPASNRFDPTIGETFVKSERGWAAGTASAA